jgi:hypothetical protein
VPLFLPGAGQFRAASADPHGMSEPGGTSLHLLADGAAPGPGAADGAAPAPAVVPAQTPAPPGSRGFGWYARAVLVAAGMLVALAAVAAAAAFLTFPRLARASHLSQRDIVWLVPVGALAAAYVAAIALRAAQRLFRNHPAEEIATVVGAIVATGTSATGMWTFFATYVPTMSPAGRVFFFAFLDIFTIAEGLRARRNMRDFKAAGVDGVAMWAGAGVSAFLSCLAATTIAEALFRLVPPLAAAWLWERTLVAERRRSRERGPRQIQWRISPERILVRLNLAEPTGRTLGDVAAQRRITQVALAAERAASLDATGASARSRGRADRRLRTALRMAVEHADLATDEDRLQQLRSQLAALRGYQSLTTLTDAPPWEILTGDRPAVDGGGQGGPEGTGPPAAPGVHFTASAGDLAAFTRVLEDLRSLIRKPSNGGPPDPAGGKQHDRQDDAGSSGHPDADAAERFAPGDYAVVVDAEAVARSLRQADGPGIHALLAERDDYADLARTVASKGLPKRVLAVIGLYATRQVSSNAPAIQWIAEHVEGPAGQVDRNEVRQVRRIIERLWAGQSRDMEA